MEPTCILINSTRRFKDEASMWRIPLEHLPEFLIAIILPMIGIWTLLVSKLSYGDTARAAERQFLVVLIVTTIVTLRTVMNCDDFWLIHMVTLATMILGAVWSPNHDVRLNPTASVTELQ